MKSKQNHGEDFEYPILQYEGGGLAVDLAICETITHFFREGLLYSLFE